MRNVNRKELKMYEDNVLNETQEDVVDLQEDAEDEVIDEEVIDEEYEEDDESEDVASPQSQEDNSKYAAARREAEAKERAAEAKAAELERKYQESVRQLEAITEATRLYGYEGTPEEISDQLIAAQREITPEEVKFERESRAKEIEGLINSHPAVQEAQRLALQNEIDRELAEIRKINPEIRTINDLKGNEDFDDLVIKHGVSLSRAYKLTYKSESLPKNETKEHLQGINTGDKSNDGMVDIPQSELAYYKESFPDDKPAKLKERYNRILKRQRGE